MITPVLAAIALLVAAAALVPPAAAADPNADLSLALSEWPSEVLVGHSFFLDMAVTNDGPTDATHVTTRYVMPSGVSFVRSSSNVTCSVTSGTVTCDLGSVAAGATKLFGIAIRAEATGVVDNTVTVSSDLADPNPSDNTATSTVRIFHAYGSAFGEQVSGLVTFGPTPWAHASDSPGAYSTTGLPTFTVDPYAYGVGANVDEAALINDIPIQVTSISTLRGFDLYYGAIYATSMTATCSATTTGRTGSVRFGSLQVYPFLYKDLAPPPNTRLNVVISPVQSATVTLNEQVLSGGAITVDAIHMRVYDSLQHAVVTDIVVGQALCSVSL
jgi:uncharacterized repeat protein (TIGR01451 family)